MQAYVIAGPGLGWEPDPPLDPGAFLAGLPVGRRVLLTLRQHGALSVTVLTDGRGLQAWEAAVGDLPFHVGITGELPEDLPGVGPCLLIRAEAVVSEQVLREFLRSGPEVRLLVGEGCSTPLAVLAPGQEMGRWLDAPEFTSGGTSGADVRIVPRGDWAALGSGSLHAAEEVLYRGLTSPSDGWVDRVLSRRISRAVTRRIVGLPVTPNQVTTLHFALGLLAAWMIAGRGYLWGVLGALLLQLSVALDCVDGEIARLKFQFSRFGSWWDVVADNLVTVAVFAAIAAAAIPRLGGVTATRLGLSAVAGVVPCVATIAALARLQERRRPGESSPLAATNRLTRDGHTGAGGGGGTLAGVINEATSRDFTVLVGAAMLAGRPEWMAWLAGIGSHVFWVLFGSYQLCLWRRRA